MKRKALGDILMEMGVIDALQLSSALAHHRQWGVPLGRALVEKRLCGHDHIVRALQRQTGLPLINLRSQQLSPDLARTLSVKVALQHRVVPVRLEGKRAETIVVAIAAPATLTAVDAVQQVSGKQRVVAHLATDEDIAYGLSVVYGLADDLAPVAPRFGSAARVENEQEFDATPVVFLYGWPRAAHEALARLITGDGMAALIIDESRLATATARDVVLAPLPSIDAAFSRGIRSSARLIVAGTNPETDLPRARALNACGFVPAPLEPAFVLHVLRRIHKAQENRTQASA